MLFKPELAQKIVESVKIQTRRPIKDNTYWMPYGSWERETLRLKPYKYDSNRHNIEKILTDWRVKWQVGRDYSVQYAYGKPCRWWNPETKELLPYDEYEVFVKSNSLDDATAMGYEPLRIRITRLRLEDVRCISEVDAVAEGFDCGLHFFYVWCGFYDKPAIPLIEKELGLIWSRPDKLYQAVAIDFEIVTV